MLTKFLEHLPQNILRLLYVCCAFMVLSFVHLFLSFAYGVGDPIELEHLDDNFGWFIVMGLLIATIFALLSELSIRAFKKVNKLAFFFGAIFELFVIFLSVGFSSVLLGDAYPDYAVFIFWLLILLSFGSLLWLIFTRGKVYALKD